MNIFSKWQINLLINIFVFICTEYLYVLCTTYMSFISVMKVSICALDPVCSMVYNLRYFQTLHALHCTISSDSSPIIHVLQPFAMLIIMFVISGMCLSFSLYISRCTSFCVKNENMCHIVIEL
jgi:hypothetical protein